MSQIEQFNSMTQSIVNKITEFKNKEITKNDLNKYMLANMSYILSSTTKIKQKNKLIDEKQYSATMKCISKIKTYHGNINFKPVELETNPIMKKLLNPTLESYIPFSELSYTTEKQFYNFYSNKKRLENDNTLPQKEEIEDKKKEITYFESPINFTKKHKSIDTKNNKDNIFNLLNESDDLLFLSSNDDETSRTIFLDNLLYSFDESNKEDPYNDDKDIFEKKIETSAFTSDEIQPIKNKTMKETFGFVNLILYNFSTSCSSRGSNGGSFGATSCGDNILGNEVYEYEFKDFLTLKTFNKYSEEMNIDYIRYLLLLYKNAICFSNENIFCEDKAFSSLMKSFLLKIGLINKKYYEEIVNSLSFIKILNSNFEIFIKAFSKILKYKDENQIHKYKLLLYLLKPGDEEEINIKHINCFMQLIKGKYVYDEEICEDIIHNLISKYNKIYCEEASINFNFRKILIILESFFYIAGK